MPGVANDDNSQKANASVESTLQNLGVEIERQMTNTPDSTNTTEPVSGSSLVSEMANTTAKATQAQGQEPPRAEPTGQNAEVDDGTKHRYTQENAKLRTVLSKLGVNPDSDIVDQLETGLMTFEDIARMRQPVQQVQTLQPDGDSSAPKLNLEDKLSNLANTLNKQKANPTLYKEDVLETQNQFMEVVKDLIQVNQNLQNAQENTAKQQYYKQITETVEGVYGAELKPNIPEDVQDVAAQMFLGYVDMANLELADQVGREKAYTPQGYAYTAKQSVPRFQKFVESVFKAGQQAAARGISTTKPGGVTALQPGVGQGSPPPPQDKTKFTEKNLQKNVDAFLAGMELQV